KGMLAPHHVSHATELILMGVVVALTIAVIAFAWSLYVKKNRLPAPEGQSLGAFHKLVYNKYYIDEVYDNTILKPMNFLAKVMDAVVERLLIDRLVNNAGRAITWGGKTLRLI